LVESDQDFSYSIPEAFITDTDNDLSEIITILSPRNSEINDNLSNTGDSFVYSLLANKPATFSLHSIYNYEFFTYEQLTKNLDSLLLPSYNLFRHDVNTDTNTVKSYGGKYNPNDVASKVLIKNINDNTINHYYTFFDKANQKLGNEVKDYDDNYYKWLTDTEMRNPSLPNDYHLKTKNIFMESTSNKDTAYIPFYNLIKINKMQKSDEYSLIDILKDLDIFFNIMVHTKREQPEVSRHKQGARNISIKKWDLNLEQLNDGVQELDDETFLKNKSIKNNKTLSTSRPIEKLKNYFDDRLKKFILYKKLQQVKKENVLNFVDMIINKKPINKVFIGFKIEKKLSLGGTTTQTFYIQSNDVQLIDTQIQYDRTYYYKISELFLSYENEYSYSTSEEIVLSYDDFDYQNKIELLFSSNVNMKIIEIPTGMLERRVLAPPLFKPDIRVYTNTQVDHKVKFLVSDRFGNSTTREDFYTVLNESDREYRERLKLAGIVNSSNRSYFSYRSRTGTFRVYKLEKKPTKYEDFADSFLGVIGDTSNLDGVPSALFTDHIKYEQKYYYLFVPISRQGQGGNPSFVQEVQLLKDADENILRYSSYELSEPEEDYINETSYRKFIQVVPNYNQTIPKSNLDMVQISETDENPKLLGPDENSLWDLRGSKFIKLRVESKSTGKKFDLNLRFKLKKP
jgi:hypothetical protein